EVHRAVGTASDEDYQTVRTEAQALLGVALYALTDDTEGLGPLGSKDSLPKDSPWQWLVQLLGQWTVGVSYQVLRPVAFEDIPKHLGWFIGCRLAERRKASA